jgi:hypothetical protein
MGALFAPSADQECERLEMDIRTLKREIKRAEGEITNARARMHHDASNEHAAAMVVIVTRNVERLLGDLDATQWRLQVVRRGRWKGQDDDEQRLLLRQQATELSLKTRLDLLSAPGKQTHGDQEHPSL